MNAWRLLREALEIYKKKRRLEELTVNSFSYAVPACEKLGFLISGREEIRGVIRYIPTTRNLCGRFHS